VDVRIYPYLILPTIPLLSSVLNIPKVKMIFRTDESKEWTDEEVYKHFNLSEDDIKLINETNIVGYKTNRREC